MGATTIHSDAARQNQKGKNTIETVGNDEHLASDGEFLKSDKGMSMIGDGTVSPSDLMLNKNSQAAKKVKASNHVVKDLAEVVIFVDSPKKAAKSPPRTPLASNMKKMSMEEPKTPESTLKRKRREDRGDSEEFNDQDKSEVEEDSVLQGKKGKVSTPSSSPRKMAKVPSTPQAKVKMDTEKQSSLSKSPTKRAPRRGKASDIIKTSDGHEEGVHGSSPRKIKKPCVWTEAEINVIGQYYIQVMTMVQPNALKAGLEEVWAQDPSLRKTAKDLSNHLAKWRKAFSALPATMLPH